jgi:hypothetical protein
MISAFSKQAYRESSGNGRPRSRRIVRSSVALAVEWPIKCVSRGVSCIDECFGGHASTWGPSVPTTSYFAKFALDTQYIGP